MRTSDNPSSHRIITLPMRNKREPTSGLEPLTCSLRVILRRCRGVQRVANPAYLSGFLFSGLLRVAPYCVPGGIRVVSGEGHGCFTILLPRARIRSYAQHLTRDAIDPQLTLDRYSRWMPSIGCNTAGGIDEALG